MAAEELLVVVLAIIIGTLAAIVYSLRILVLLERRIARMDENLLIITKKIAEEELKIEHEQEVIEATIRGKPKKRK